MKQKFISVLMVLIFFGKAIIFALPLDCVISSFNKNSVSVLRTSLKENMKTKTKKCDYVSKHKDHKYVYEQVIKASKWHLGYFKIPEKQYAWIDFLSIDPSSLLSVCISI